MLTKLLLLTTLSYFALSKDCLKCICERESNCKAIGCNTDAGTTSCGYFQIKLPYYKECGTPGLESGENVVTAWKRCADDYSCASTCVENYVNRYSYKCDSITQSSCEIMARLHNGGPNGCNRQGTRGYWSKIETCLND